MTVSGALFVAIVGVATLGVHPGDKILFSLEIMASSV